MDLTKQPPRRPSNCNMAGIVAMGRMADKARGHNAELQGAYTYGDDSGLDRQLLEFINMSADDFAAAADDLDDAALGALVLERAQKSEAEIAAFNKDQLEREPHDERHQVLLKERVEKYAAGRTDITTVLASIELDDWGLFRDVDLTQRPPRSPYDRGVADTMAVARMADKARAAKIGKLGEYKYGDDSGLDESIMEFYGFNAEEFIEAAYWNVSDADLSDWIAGRTPRTAAEVSAFNSVRTNFGRYGAARERFLGRRAETYPQRTDIQSFFDLIDCDDEQSFGLVDLTRHAPRSPYDTSVGGVTSLGRLIDKARAFNGGTQGLYWYGEDSGIDRGVLEFLGLSQEEFAAGLKEQDTDEAVVAWLGDRLPQGQEELDAFNTRLQTLGPSNERTWNFLRGAIASIDPSRKEIASFFALMVLEDQVFFARRQAAV